MFVGGDKFTTWSDVVDNKWRRLPFIVHAAVGPDTVSSDVVPFGWAIIVAVHEDTLKQQMLRSELIKMSNWKNTVDFPLDPKSELMNSVPPVSSESILISILHRLKTLFNSHHFSIVYFKCLINIDLVYIFFSFVSEICFDPIHSFV